MSWFGFVSTLIKRTIETHTSCHRDLEGQFYMIYKVRSNHIIQSAEQIIRSQFCVLNAKQVSFVVIHPGPVWESSSHLCSGRQHVPQHDDRPGEPVRHHQVWADCSPFRSPQNTLIPPLSSPKTRWSVHLPSGNILSAGTESEEWGKWGVLIVACDTRRAGRRQRGELVPPVMCSAEPVKGTLPLGWNCRPLGKRGGGINRKKI